jgi:hypothetical protein
MEGGTPGSPSIMGEKEWQWSFPVAKNGERDRWRCSDSHGRGGVRGGVEHGAARRWDAHGAPATLDSDCRPTWTVARFKMNLKFE